MCNYVFLKMIYEAVSMDITPITFLSDGDIIRGNLLLPSITDFPQPTIIKCHGLPGSSNQVSGIATELARAGFIVLTFDFRGVRNSNGQFSYSNAIMDIGYAITFLESYEFVDKHRIALYGASFGGAVAISRATFDLRIRCVAVRAPIFDTKYFFEKLEQIYSNHSLFSRRLKVVRGLSSKNAWISMKEDGARYNPMKTVDLISPRALLVVTGDQDQVIDLEGVKRLFMKAKDPKKLEIVTGADHILSNPESFKKTNQIIITWFHWNLMSQ